MPRLKKAIDGNGTLFYPITISKGVWDIDRNQRLSATLAEKADKVSGATNNNLAALNSNGNLKDAGVSVADLVLTTALAESVADDKGFAMCMAIVHLSNISTLTSITNPEWYYVITDSQDKVLCGVKKNGKAYVYATVEEIMSCIISSYNT